MTKRYYRPELDALRFFAFLCVFTSHKTEAVGPGFFRAIGRAGDFGVPVFFLLSAFLITELLLREREATGTVHIRAFYVRRVLRIWPLYFAVYWAWWLGHYLSAGPQPGASLYFTFFLGNWFIAHHGWMNFTINPLWSISVEEQFYICIPVLMRFGGRRALKAMSGVLLFSSYIVITHFAVHHNGGDAAEWCNSFFQFQFFAAGIQIALLLHGRTFRFPPLARVAAVMLALAAWFAAAGPLHARIRHPGDPMPMPNIVQAISGWGLVLIGAILFFVAVVGIPSRFVPRWLSYLGKISYGLYVFHCFVIYFLVWHGPLAQFELSIGLTTNMKDAANTGLVLLITIGISALSYWGFESPFLRLKERFTFVESRPVSNEAQ